MINNNSTIEKFSKTSKCMYNEKRDFKTFELISFCWNKATGDINRVDRDKVWITCH